MWAVDYASKRNSHNYFGNAPTATDAERLSARPQDLQDNATPSGNAMMATVPELLGGDSGQQIDCLIDVTRRPRHLDDAQPAGRHNLTRVDDVLSQLSDALAGL